MICDEIVLVCIFNIRPLHLSETNTPISSSIASLHCFNGGVRGELGGEESGQSGGGEFGGDEA